MENSKRVLLTEKHMGGNFIFQCFPKSSQDKKFVEAGALYGFEEVERVESLLTDFKDSPFNEINYFAGKRPVKVCSEIFEIVKRSLELSKKSEGAFDISFASVGHYWRECRKSGSAPDEKKVASLSRLINFKMIELNQTDRSVFLPEKEMRIGLGGIGKGYAVDQGFEKIKSIGINNFYFNGSGDIRVDSSSCAPRPWKIGVRNPFSEDSNQSCGLIQVVSGAVATSGIYNNFIRGVGKNTHHILDPRSGHSSEGLVSATVQSETAEVCDTTATLVMVLGQKRGMKYLNNNNIDAFLIDNTGKVHLSKKAFSNINQPAKDSAHA